MINRRHLLGLAALALAIAPSIHAGEPAATSGENKPTPLSPGMAVSQAVFDVQMTSTDDKVTSIGAIKGAKGTLVIFACNHCPFVKAWLDRIVAIGNGASAKGVGFILINSNDPGVVPEDGLEPMKALATSKGMKFPYVVDAAGKLARAFGAGRTPEAFLLNADGTVVYHGAIDDNGEDAKAATQHYLADAVEAVSSGREVPVKETKAIGCSIKFPPQG